ncbi:hypothetical protein [Streptomyces corynorhini]|uniref:XRE family transcriptional regulator n=1 Tax=Streptomyces corynorhini TaxID=2282652 RepID=A0A370BGF2_9ACTN|nr:hypothetical protein [Streptomyces corynorhini]RDG38495.1 hypothetical protein DVH02_08935 [Streptomyces corynorhini]
MTTLLRVLIDEMRWKDYRIFIDQYQRAARSLAEKVRDPSLATHTVSDRTFERWYAGRVTPQNEARRILAHLFMRPINELLAEAPSKAPIAMGPRMTGEFSATHTTIRAAPGADQYEMGRNAAMAARRAMDFAMGAEQKRAGQETLDYLHTEVRRIAEIHLRVPVGTILDDLTYIQDTTFRLLESGRVKPSQSRDLFLLAAIQSGMLAKAGHDLGDPQSAMMQARTASVCADQAEHQALRAWVKGLQSAISYWANRPEDSLHYARQGVEISTELHSSVTVWLAAQEARAAALLGDAKTVRAAIRRAEELRERTRPDDLDDLGGNFFFPQIRQTFFGIEAEVLLGDNDVALVRRAEDAVRELKDANDPYWAFAAEAGCQSNLALARLQMADLEGTAEAVRPVLDLPPNRRNAGIISSVRRVETSLRSGPSRNSVMARELCEKIAAFSRNRPLALRR